MKASLCREIEELLARASRVSDVPAERVEELATSRGVDLARRYRTPRLNLYRRFLECCLLDQSVSSAEAADLSHLRAILRIEDEDAARVHEEVAHAVYGRAVDQVLEDQRLDPEEEAFLRRLGKELELSDDAAQRIYSEGEERARQRYLSKAVVRDDFILTSRDVVLALSGSSDESLEAAVRAAVDEASHAVSDLDWVELSNLGADVSEGGITRWHVKLRARRVNGGA